MIVSEQQLVAVAGLSAYMAANAEHPSVWLDDEAQAELGEVRRVGRTGLVGTREALTFMADNIDDALAEDVWGRRHMTIYSYVALARQLRAAAAA